MKNPFVKAAKPSVLTINGGSSSIKFALYEAGKMLKRGLYGTHRVTVRIIRTDEELMITRSVLHLC